ncbi:hypothetical protein MKX03_024093 [Papaver bracteatum]|nr:hypothetical protein MKX03_024093 [Papaver bracteatum]
MFTLTFCSVSVSGYQEDVILKLAHKRVSTVALGCLTCVIMSIFVFPVWAGHDLHKLIAHNIEKQAYFLQGFRELYFGTKGDTDMSWLHGYRIVLNSMTAEEAMANFARWEPPHGIFRLETLSNIITSEIKCLEMQLAAVELAFSLVRFLSLVPMHPVLYRTLVSLQMVLSPGLDTKVNYSIASKNGQ